MSPPQQLRQQTSNCSSLLTYRPRKDERLSWPSWLTYSGWLTHISGHPSATSRAQDSENTSAKDRCSTAGAPKGKASWVPSKKVAWAKAYLHTKWHLNPPAVWPQWTWAENWRGCVLFKGELGPHLTQCRLGQGIPLYQVAS